MSTMEYRKPTRSPEQFAAYLKAKRIAEREARAKRDANNKRLRPGNPPRTGGHYKYALGGRRTCGVNRKRSFY